MAPQTFTSQSLSDTSQIAQQILTQLSGSPRTNGATILALSGDLGAGKTAFTKLFAGHLGITETVVSPTFVLAKFYDIPGQQSPWEHLVHIDAYRLESWQELQVLKFDDVFNNPKNLILIEWPEQVADTDQAPWIQTRIQLDGENRLFTVEA